MTDHRFDTPGPIRLYCELGRGGVRCTATDTDTTTIEVTGPVADQVSVHRDGDEISIVAPRQRTGFFGGEPEVFVDVLLPSASDAMIKSGSAGLRLDGTYAGCVLRSGSGEVSVETLTGPSRFRPGSGDVTVGAASAELRVKSGSGDVHVEHAEGGLAVSTGSGDVRVETARGPITIKTGSGDLVVADSQEDLSMTTASGDMVVSTARRGRLTLRGASGDVQVGIPSGTPVWTDITTLTGDISSSLTSAGEPAEGADYVELHAKTVSGDIALRQV